MGKSTTKTRKAKHTSNSHISKSQWQSLLSVLLPVVIAGIFAWFYEVTPQTALGLWKSSTAPLYDEKILRDRTFFDMVDIPGKGKGLVANRDIQQGELVIVEKPLILVPTKIPKDYLTELFQNWTDSQFDALFDLTFTRLPESAPPDMNLDPATQTDAERLILAEGIIRNNAVGLKPGFLGVFPRMARLNHACAGAFNMMYHWRDQDEELRVYALKGVKRGEELLTTYLDSRKTRADRLDHLEKSYGFRCSCSVCSLSEEESLESDHRLLEMKRLYPQFSSWNDGIISGPEAIALAKQILQYGIEEGFWNERGQVAEEAAYVAAAHGDASAARDWSKLANKWASIEWGADSDRAKRSRRVMTNPKSHHQWAARERIDVGGPPSKWL